MKFIPVVKVILSVVPGFAWQVLCLAGPGIPSVSARSQAMGNIGVMLSGPWSGLHNQAGLATVDQTRLAFHYENHFMVAETGLEAFILCIPSKTGTIGLNYSFYGCGAYNESETGLTFGRSFGDKFRAGIEINYLRIHQPFDYGNLHAMVPGAGIQVLPVDNLIIAVHVFNPANQNFSNHKNSCIPSVIRAGAGWMLGNEVLICFELTSTSTGNHEYAAGIEYSVSEKLVARTGILLGEFARASFGLGFLVNIFQIDLSVNRHPVLGYSPAVSVTFSKDHNR